MKESLISGKIRGFTQPHTMLCYMLISGAILALRLVGDGSSREYQHDQAEHGNDAHLDHGRPLRLVHALTGRLRDFSWLTPQRVAFYSGVLLLAYLVAAICQLANSHHLIFESGLCVGGDFVDSYAASIAAL